MQWLETYVDGGAFPIFFLWRSDLITTVTRNLPRIAEELIFRRLAKDILRLVAGKLGPGGTRGVTLQPPPPESVSDNLAQQRAEAEPIETQLRTLGPLDLTSLDELVAEEEFNADDVLQNEANAIALARNPTGAGRARGGGALPLTSRPSLMSPGVIDEFAQEQGVGTRSVFGALAAVAQHGIAILRRVLRRFTERHDHGLHTTIVEEILRELYVEALGGTIWGEMKQDTRHAFGGNPLRHGGTAFVAQLQQWWKPGRRLTLVGHSTGAIYIGHMLDQIDQALPKDRLVDVVFLAPACTFGFVHGQLAVWKRRVRNFRMFALRDTVERGYYEVPVVYPASLLYLVSGLFEESDGDTPLLGMERYHSGAAPYDGKEMREVVQWIDSRSNWSKPAGTAGWESAALKHGGFGEDPSTRASLRHLLAKGF